MTRNCHRHRAPSLDPRLPHPSSLSVTSFRSPCFLQTCFALRRCWPGSPACWACWSVLPARRCIGRSIWRRSFLLPATIVGAGDRGGRARSCAWVRLPRAGVLATAIAFVVAMPFTAAPAPVSEGGNAVHVAAVQCLVPQRQARRRAEDDRAEQCRHRRACRNDAAGSRCDAKSGRRSIPTSSIASARRVATS